MTVRFHLKKLRRMRVGPLVPHVEGFAALFSQQGYSLNVGRQKMGLVAALSRWLERKHIRLQDLEEGHIDAFFRARWRHVGCHHGDKATMAALLQYLRQSQVISTPTPAPAPPTELDLLEQEYRSFLTQERGLVETTVTEYAFMARRFLVHCFRNENIRLKKLRAKDVTDFLLHGAPHYSRGSVQFLTTVLRSFLGFLFQRGLTSTNLAVAVPTVPRGRLAGLPQFLEAKQVEQVLRSCDRRTGLGKRNYAILLLLARLGLRASEVAKLTLDDIDWRASELLIRGKGAQLDKLPLLQDVGQALADYLKKARPDCSSRQVFIRPYAPYVGFSGRTAVSFMVRRTLARAHIQAPHQGAHVLRHSLATRMLGRGASLAQIGQVLRHRLVASTEIYAKVNLNALRRLALPWQGGAL